MAPNIRITILISPPFMALHFNSVYLLLIFSIFIHAGVAVNPIYSVPMDPKTEISWIFLAIGYASQKQAADFAAISKFANGINYGAPTHNQLHNAVSRLLELNLINKQNKKYVLSNSGVLLLAQVQEKEKAIPGVWKELEDAFDKIIGT